MRIHVRPWLVLVLVGLLFGAIWYRLERPAASFKETIGAIGRPDAMTVEAIAEGGSSIIGRNVSIVDAVVTKVTGDRSFWIAGDEGPPLLVVALPASSDGVNVQMVPSLKKGDRVQVNGVVREGRRDGLSEADQSELAKASVYVIASEVISAEPPMKTPK